MTANPPINSPTSPRCISDTRRSPRARQSTLARMSASRGSRSRARGRARSPLPQHSPPHRRAAALIWGARSSQIRTCPSINASIRRYQPRASVRSLIAPARALVCRTPCKARPAPTPAPPAALRTRLWTSSSSADHTNARIPTAITPPANIGLEPLSIPTPAPPLPSHSPPNIVLGRRSYQRPLPSYPPHLPETCPHRLPGLHIVTIVII